MAMIRNPVAMADAGRRRTLGLSTLARWLAHAFSDGYRPELHYMRGPGPKWHAKHASPPAPADTGVPMLARAKA